MSQFYTEDEKIKAEVEKLKAEEKKLKAEEQNLSYPLRQPVVWITLITLLISLLSNVLQAFNGEKDRKLAKIETETLKLDGQKLEDRKKKLSSEINTKLEVVNDASSKVVQIEKRLASLKSQLESAQITKEAFAIAVSKSASDVAEVTQNVAKDIKDPLSRANKKELEGFSKLAEGDFNAAMKAFQLSEDSVNGYHSVYELSIFLEKNKEHFTDLKKQKELIQKIVDEYYGYIPPEDLKKLKKILNT
jgi:hypothetical protein